MPPRIPLRIGVGRTGDVGVLAGVTSCAPPVLSGVHLELIEALLEQVDLVAGGLL